MIFEFHHMTAFFNLTHLRILTFIRQIRWITILLKPEKGKIN